MQMKIDMPGLRELDAQLAELGTVVATRVAGKAIRASAELLQSGWQRGAPYAPEQSRASLTYGHARENIKVGRVRPQKENAVVFKVTTGDAFWMYFYEFGTFQQPARPTFRPIIETMKEQCLDVQIEVLRAGIEQQVAKARRVGRSR